MFKRWNRNRKLFVLFTIICAGALVSVLFHFKYLYTALIFLQSIKIRPVQISSGKYLKTNGHHNFGTNNWRSYYPEVAEYLSNIEKGNIQWPIAVLETTSPKFSFVEIIPPPKNTTYKVGDVLQAIIHAKNGYDIAKTYGSDYFHVRLIGIGRDGKPNGDALSPEVKDHGNGSYTIVAPLLWKGKTRLTVELVHSSEAIATLINSTSGFVGPGIIFYGTYSKGDAKECNVGLEIRDQANPPCNFSRPKLGITWYCYRPKNKKCTDLEWIGLREVEEESIKLGKRPLFTTNVTWKVSIKGSGSTFGVSATDFLNKMLHYQPPCNHLSGVREEANETRFGKISGMYMDGRWVSFQCQNIETKYLVRASKCLQNKIIYIIGDSTLRQWYMLLAKVLEFKREHGDGRIWQRPRHGRKAASNVTVHYFGHGSPLHGAGPPLSRPYVVDTLSTIHPRGTGKGVYIVLNLALHFCLVDTVVYIRRLTAIRRSVRNLLKRRPDVVVIIRGCIRHKNSKIAVPSEWFSFRLCKILRGIFSELPNVGFIDTWSMTSAHAPWDMHPSNPAVEEHFALFMSYICPIA